MAAGRDFEKIVREFLNTSTPNVSDALDRLEINGAPMALFLCGPNARKSSARQQR